jgi:predicted DNA-binding transcriptional regulator AlpA
MPQEHISSRKVAAATGMSQKTAYLIMKNFSSDDRLTITET